MTVVAKTIESEAPGWHAGPASRQFERFSKRDDIIQPLYNPSQWAQYTETSTRLKRCISIMAHNTVARGWAVKLNEDKLKNLLQTDQDIAKRQRDRLEELLEHPNADTPLSTLLLLTKTDEEATGNGYIEVVRDAVTGLPARMYHMPSASTRISVDGYFVELKYRMQRYFQQYGSGLNLNYKTGKEMDSLPPMMKASEVLHFKVYSPLDRYYGVPRGSTADIALKGLHDASMRNVHFFKFDAMPKLAVIVKGGAKEDGEAIESALNKFVKQNRGNNKSSRVLLLQVLSTPKGDNPDIVVQELGKYSKDATFQDYRRDCQEEIREAFGLALILFGTADDVNRASAVATLKATVENIFHPETMDYSYRLTHSIAKDFHSLLSIELQKADVSDLAFQADVLKTWGELGIMSLNELRQEIGLPPSDDDRSNYPLVLLRQDEKKEQDGEQLMETLASGIRSAKAALIRP